MKMEIGIWIVGSLMVLGLVAWLMRREAAYQSKYPGSVVQPPWDISGKYLKDYDAACADARAAAKAALKASYEENRKMMNAEAALRAQRSLDTMATYAAANNVVIRKNEIVSNEAFTNLQDADGRQTFFVNATQVTRAIYRDARRAAKARVNG